MIKDLWYKNAIVYCVHVGAFMDSNGDGSGDFEGLMRRLDYLASLGIATPTGAAVITSRWSRMATAGIESAASATCSTAPITERYGSIRSKSAQIGL